MEQDKYISLCDSYIEIQGNEKDVTQYIDDYLDGKIRMILTTKPLLKTPVILTKKKSEKIIKMTLYLFIQIYK